MALKISTWDSAELLNSQEAIAACIEVAFEDGDTALIAHALGVVGCARESGINSVFHFKGSVPFDTDQRQRGDHEVTCGAMKQGEGDLALRSRTLDCVERQLRCFPDQMQSDSESEIDPQRPKPMPLRIQVMRTSVIMPLAM